MVPNSFTSAPPLILPSNSSQYEFSVDGILVKYIRRCYRGNKVVGHMTVVSVTKKNGKC